MKSEKIRITDEQRKSLKLENPTIGDICTLGDTKCIDGNIYLCQLGDDLEPDWFFTNELCGFQSQTFGNMVITEKSNISTTSSKPEEVTFELSGIIGESAPKVYTREMRSIIQIITGYTLNIPGVSKFSGTGTNILILEFWPSGVVGNRYLGKASCTVILK